MGKVRVVVRCRPFRNKEDQNEHYHEASVRLGGGRWHIDTQRVLLRADTAGGGVGGGGGSGFDKVFPFDRVYDGVEPQQDFFASEVVPLLRGALALEDVESTPTTSSSSRSTDIVDGPVNVVLFAYGQTGSGKTHTMDGAAAAVVHSGPPPSHQRRPCGEAALKSRSSSTPNKKGTASPSRRSDSPSHSELVPQQGAPDSAMEEVDATEVHDRTKEEEGETSDNVLGGTSDTEDDRGDISSAMTSSSSSPLEGVAPRALRYLFSFWQTQKSKGSVSTSASATAAGTTMEEELLTHDGEDEDNSSDDLDATTTSSVSKLLASGRPPLASARFPAAPQAAAYQLVQVSVSFLEIYNEKLFDLLSASHHMATDRQDGFRRRRLAPSPSMIAVMHSGCLRLRRCMDPSAASANSSSRSSRIAAKFEVENLTRISCISLDEALSYYRYGVSKKVFRGHNLNSHSSRAHSIFTIYLTFRNNTAAEDGTGGTSEAPLITSEVAIVDLAGSERLHSILPDVGSSPSSSFGNHGQVQQQQQALISESIHINKSLLTLGKVIVALSDAALAEEGRRSAGGGDLGKRSGGTPRGVRPQPYSSLRVLHTPYRDSKLTMVINHALGGNARTLMIACIHLDPSQKSESLSTLFYASRTSKISNSVISLEDPKTVKIKALMAEVSSLKIELSAANETIRNMKSLSSENTAIATRVNASLDGQQPTTDGGRMTLQHPPASSTTTKAMTHSTSDSTTSSVRPSASPAAAAVPSLSSILVPPETASSSANERSTILNNKSNIESDELFLDLSSKLQEACVKLKTVLEANGRLRQGFDQERQRAALLERERDETETENARLREKLDLYDTLLLAQIAINREYDASSSTFNKDDGLMGLDQLKAAVLQQQKRQSRSVKGSKALPRRQQQPSSSSPRSNGSRRGDVDEAFQQLPPSPLQPSTTASMGAGHHRRRQHHQLSTSSRSNNGIPPPPPPQPSVRPNSAPFPRTFDGPRRQEEHNKSPRTYPTTLPEPPQPPPPLMFHSGLPLSVLLSKPATASAGTASGTSYPRDSAPVSAAALCL